MTEVILVSCLALISVLLVMSLRLHRKRTVEELIRAIARINERARIHMGSPEAREPVFEPECSLRRLRDLAIFWWNSRLFVQISSQLLAAADLSTREEVAQVAARIQARHKQLLKLVVVSWAERMMENVVRVHLGQYRSQSVICYLDAEDSLRYLIAYWRPESEGLLGEKL